MTETLLALDYGRARIGVAVGNRLTGSAQPLEPVDGRDEQRALGAVEALIREWRARVVVVGLPLGLDGNETPMTGLAREFAGQLEERCGVTVHLHDERLTSREAEARFAQARADQRMRRRDRRLLDSMAAGLILESWMAAPGQG